MKIKLVIFFRKTVTGRKTLKTNGPPAQEVAAAKTIGPKNFQRNRRRRLI